jgi:hypothetical protein
MRPILIFLLILALFAAIGCEKRRAKKAVAKPEPTPIYVPVPSPFPAPAPQPKPGPHLPRRP